jgi:putative transposase
MARKSYKPEEIVAKLRQVDVLTSQGQSVAEAIRSIGVSEVTYYLYGRLSLSRLVEWVEGQGGAVRLI